MEGMVAAVIQVAADTRAAAWAVLWAASFWAGAEGMAAGDPEDMDKAKRIRPARPRSRANRAATR